MDEVILPDSELDMMNAIWDAEDTLKRPVYTREINEFGSEHVKRIQTTTMLTFLARLQYKGFIEFKREGQQKYYSSLVMRPEYQRRAYQSFIEKVFSGDRQELARMLVADMSEDELAAALDLLKQE